jgi:hypothetical protein
MSGSGHLSPNLDGGTDTKSDTIDGEKPLCYQKLFRLEGENFKGDSFVVLVDREIVAPLALQRYSVTSVAHESLVR